MLGLLAVFAATAAIVGGITLLESFRVQSGKLVDARELTVEARLKDLNDAMRRITKGLGFNVVIIPKGQNLDDPFASDFAMKFMPEAYADRLANSEIVTVNHLLPILEQRVEWPEKEGRALFLTGVKGQVPLAHRDPKKPIMQPVPKHGIVLGSTLAREEELEVGDRVELRSESFEVVKVQPRRGDKRDLTAWIDLQRMQKMFERSDQINAIWALECSCAMADVDKVREEISRILPDVEVEEQGEKALARAEARKKAHDLATQALADEKADRERIDVLAQRFRNIYIPLILVSGAIWLALLAFTNTRDRRYEIGLLHALGVSGAGIGTLFLLRAAATGILGAIPGYFAGAWVGGQAFRVSTESEAVVAFNGPLFLGVVLAAPLLSALACWLPAVAATQQDPGIVLRAEG